MSNLWPDIGRGRLRNLNIFFFFWREGGGFLRWHLTEKQRGYLQNGRLREAVAFENVCRERADCVNQFSNCLVILK